MASMDIYKKPMRLFIQVKEAAAVLGVNEKTLYGWIAEGIGPPVQRYGQGRLIRIHYQRFLTWCEKPRRRKKKADA